MVKFDFHNKAKRFINLEQKVGWKGQSLICIFLTLFTLLIVDVVPDLIKRGKHFAVGHRYKTT